jgi:hypothetical protein
MLTIIIETYKFTVLALHLYISPSSPKGICASLHWYHIAVIRKDINYSCFKWTRLCFVRSKILSLIADNTHCEPIFMHCRGVTFLSTGCARTSKQDFGLVSMESVDRRTRAASAGNSFG